MAYVDLNPIRAKIASSPEASDHTFIQMRIHALQNQKSQPKSLAPFTGALSESNAEQVGVPFELADYLSLVDWTGRAIRSDKRGSINRDLPPILIRLSMSPDLWLQLTNNFGRNTTGLTGSHDKRRIAAELLGYKRVPRVTQNRQYFS